MSSVRREFHQLVDMGSLCCLGGKKRAEKPTFSPLSGDTHHPTLPRFTDQDEHVIQHCFHYTGTVLTSTLAFQKEQKLKCECQVSACLELFLGTSSRSRRLSTRTINSSNILVQLGNPVTWKTQRGRSVVA